MIAVSRIAKKLHNSEFLFQTVVSIAVRVLAALATFLFSVVIGRQLGADNAGYYFLAFSIVTVLSAISRAGLDSTVVRFVGAEAPDLQWGRVRSVVNRSLFLAISITVPVAGVVYFFSNFIAVEVFTKPALAGVLKGMAPGIIGLSLFTLLAMGLQGLRKVIASVLTLNVFVNFILILLLIAFSITTPEQAAIGYSGASLAAAFLGYIIYRRSLQPGSGIILWTELFQSCFPLWVVVVMTQLTQFSGQFIAGAWVASDEIAQLAVAQRTALLTSFILMAVNLVVAPRFASMYKKGEMNELESLALSSVKLMVLFALPIVLFMVVFPGFILSLFGEGFSEGAVYLQILAIGQFVNVVTGSVGYLLAMSGHEKDFRNTVLISGPIAVGLGFALVPFYGAIGSAIATAVAVATQNLVAVWWVKKRLGFNTLAVWR